ncbi:MAG: GNAT family N-acetyltransferase [Pseudonocardiales bacterium]
MDKSDQPTVSLRQMTEDEFSDWRPRSIESFASDLAQAMHRPLDAARPRAQAQFDEELSGGIETPGTWLLLILNEDSARVGTLWIGPHPQRPGAAYVYDIEIQETARRRGYGRAAMLAAEDLVRSEGINELSLSVFGFNDSAKRLYDSIGYRVLATQMTKLLSL